MRRFATILGLLAVLALAPAMECAAQTPAPAAAPAGSGTAAAAPQDLAGFLATLSGAQGSPAGVPSSTLGFQWIPCTTNEDCPQGQLCCYPCGIDGCDFVCMEPQRGRCPIIA